MKFVPIIHNLSPDEPGYHQIQRYNRLVANRPTLDGTLATKVSKLQAWERLCNHALAAARQAMDLPSDVAAKPAFAGANMGAITAPAPRVEEEYQPGISIRVPGEANTYDLLSNGEWLAQIRWNGELGVAHQRMLTGHIARSLEGKAMVVVTSGKAAFMSFRNTDEAFNAAIESGLLYVGTVQAEGTHAGEVMYMGDWEGRAWFKNTTTRQYISHEL